MRIAAQKGEPIPLGWALDRDGNPPLTHWKPLKELFFPLVSIRDMVLVS